MLVIKGGRGNGKTLEIVKISYEKQIPILCLNSIHKERIKNIAYRNNWRIPEPIIFYDLKIKSTGNHKGVLIDDFEYFIKYILHNEELYAVSIDDSFKIEVKELKNKEV